MSDRVSLWIVVYQASDASRMAQIRDLLRFAGNGVRPCVFEVAATEAAMHRLVSELMAFIEDRDLLNIYRVCHACRKETKAYGRGGITGIPQAIIV